MFKKFFRPETVIQPSAKGGSAATTVGETATVRRIVARLEALPPEEARYLAGFAYVMSRAAQADLEISEAETRTMEQAVLELGDLDEPQAVLVVQMAKFQARSQGETEDYLVTREFGRFATLEQKLAVLRCCFLVAVSDGSISAEEAAVVNEIAHELDVPRPQLNAVREEFVEKFSAIQSMRQREAGAS
jgi:tellurite resistance protein